MTTPPSVRIELVEDPTTATWNWHCYGPVGRYVQMLFSGEGAASEKMAHAAAVRAMGALGIAVPITVKPAQETRGRGRPRSIGRDEFRTVTASL